jgi:hypothetical protein
MKELTSFDFGKECVEVERTASRRKIFKGLTLFYRG